MQERGLGDMQEVFDVRTVNEHRGANDEDPLPGPEGEDYPVLGEQFEPAWEPRGSGAPHPVPDLDVLINPGLRLGVSGGTFVPETVQAHRDWLLDYASGRDYLILDPIYMLAGISTNDEAAVIDLLNFLTKIKTAGCAVIFSHQSSKHSDKNNRAASIMGSTFIPAWYEAAMFPRRDSSGLFSIEFDNLREMGETTDLTLQGQGVGRWHYTDDAQNRTDSLGRKSPQAASKASALAILKELLQESPHFNDEQLAQRMQKSVRTIKNYRKELANEAV